MNPDDFKLENVSNDSEVGHMLEVDIDYPESLHDLHNDYPFCPEQIFVEDEMLSDFSKNIAEKHKLTGSKYTKLISSFCKKKYYSRAKFETSCGCRTENIENTQGFEIQPETMDTRIYHVQY